MKITRVECLHADAGYRNFDFLKISTDAGLVGWSEYNESFGGKGVTSAIQHLAPVVVGRDPFVKSRCDVLAATMRCCRGSATAARERCIHAATLEEAR